MAVTYTKQQREAAKKSGGKLATIDAGGISFSGPVTPEEQVEITRFLLAFLDRRAANADRPLKEAVARPLPSTFTTGVMPCND